MIYSAILIEIKSNKVVVRFPNNYRGPVLYCKGASAQEKAQATSLSNLTNAMTNNYNTLFSGQQAIFKGLTAAFSPIVAAGPNQYGFSQQEDTALRTEAGEKTASAFAQSEKALQNRVSAQGGGNTGLPSGVTAQLENTNYAAAAGEEANQSLQITQAGYTAGREEFNQAAGVEEQTAGLLNSTAAGSAAADAGSNAFSAQSTVSQQNNAGSFGAIAAGLIGGAADSFLGGFGKAVGA